MLDLASASFRSAQKAGKAGLLDGEAGPAGDSLAFSMAMDLMFNGQNMDYAERPLSLSAFNAMAFFNELSKGDRVGVVGPGGGRLVKTLVEKGFVVDAFEGREECVDHLRTMFKGDSRVTIRPYEDLTDPYERDDMSYKALFNMDDLRAFRDNEAWTEEIGAMIQSHGYFVYSQVSNQLPKKRNTLSDHFQLIGNYNVSDQTAAEIRASYFGVETWDPSGDQYEMAKETLKLVESAASLRRNILSGVEIRYFVWQRHQKTL